jgi:hypothetical protein
MNREQFFRVVSGLDEDRLRRALWNLYWRGTANVRERIEVELASDGLRRVRCGGGVMGVDMGTPRVPDLRRNRCAAIGSVGVHVRLDPLRRRRGRGEGDSARRRACAHAARCGHVGRLRRAVRAGAGRGVARRLASPAGKVSSSLIRSARLVGSSAACRGVWPSSAGMGSSSHLVS